MIWLGLYSVTYTGIPPYDDISVFDDAAQAGFDFVHMYHDQQPLAQAEDFLQKANDVGLKVLQNMPYANLGSEDAYWIDWVSTLAEHDNLLWWYLPEEPILKEYDHADMLQLYEIVKEHDPRKRDAVLYFGSWHSREQWPDWSADVIAGGGYPELHTNSNTRVHIWNYREGLKVCNEDVLTALPFFDATIWGGPGTFPSVENMRYDALSTMINGADRMCWFGYSYGRDLDGLWVGLKNTILEIRRLDSLPDSTQTVNVEITSGLPQVTEFWGGYDSIQTLIKEDDEFIYLIACNLLWDQVGVKFSGLPIDNGSFIDTFEANEVKIYKLLIATIQTTFNLSNSIRAQRIDSPLAGIQHADRQHSDTSGGKL